MTTASCPHCAFQGEIEAFFADDDEKGLFELTQRQAREIENLKSMMRGTSRQLAEAAK